MSQGSAGGSSHYVHVNHPLQSFHETSLCYYLRLSFKSPNPGLPLLLGYQPSVTGCHHHCGKPNLYWSVRVSAAAQRVFSASLLHLSFAFMLESIISNAHLYLKMFTITLIYFLCWLFLKNYSQLYSICLLTIPKMMQIFVHCI